MCVRFFFFFSERSDRNGGRRSWTEEASKRTRESRGVAVREVAEKSLFLCVVPHPSTPRFAHPIQLFPRARPRGTTPPKEGGASGAGGGGGGAKRRGRKREGKGEASKKEKGSLLTHLPLPALARLARRVGTAHQSIRRNQMQGTAHSGPFPRVSTRVCSRSPKGRPSVPEGSGYCKGGH